MEGDNLKTSRTKRMHMTGIIMKWSLKLARMLIQFSCRANIQQDHFYRAKQQGAILRKR